jgi:hypothetical protein
MKKDIKWLIITVIIVSFSFFITIVYAFSFNDVFSWISNSFGRITGYVTNVTEACPYECCFKDPTYQDKECEYPKDCEGYKCVNVETTTTTIPSTTTPVVVQEEVKCVFLNSNSEQKCFTSDWKYACRGLGACANTVSGEYGAKLTWGSSCGGEYITTIDSYNDVIEFKCETLVTTTSPQIQITTTTPSTTSTTTVPPETMTSSITSLTTTTIPVTSTSTSTTTLTLTSTTTESTTTTTVTI